MFLGINFCVLAYEYEILFKYFIFIGVYLIESLFLACLKSVFSVFLIQFMSIYVNMVIIFLFSIFKCI